MWELVSAGLVTADGFDNLRAFLDPKRRAGQGRGRATRPRYSTGRWSLLYADEMASQPASLEAVAELLLRRYGVVFRELLARENFPIRWREMLITLRRLEDRGEVRGGRFVDGFLGEQFALPVAVESLRAMRREAMSEERVTVSAADPLNMAGILVPGDRVPASRPVCNLCRRRRHRRGTPGGSPACRGVVSGAVIGPSLRWPLELFSGGLIQQTYLTDTAKLLKIVGKAVDI